MNIGQHHKLWLALGVIATVLILGTLLNPLREKASTASAEVPVATPSAALSPASNAAHPRTPLAAHVSPYTKYAMPVADWAASAALPRASQAQQLRDSGPVPNSLDLCGVGRVPLPRAAAAWHGCIGR